jgi:hypothetical protein
VSIGRTDSSSVIFAAQLVLALQFSVLVWTNWWLPVMLPAP